MAEVASASVALLPTFKGGPKQIEQVMAPALDKAGVAGGERYGNSLAGAIMSSSAVKQLVAAGGFGAVLFAGFDRLRAIDQAQAKLRGLGNDAQQVESVMDSALKSVQGTAFGLGDAATIAASALAAGVKGGEDLTRYLTLVANTAAVTDQSLLNVGATLNNVRTLNAAYNDSLQILSQKGLPVYQALADQLGVTTAEVKKLASEGRISADVLETALAGQVGDAAAEMGKSFTGVVDNMQASIGRIGAGLAGGNLQGPTAAVTELTGALKAAEPVATALGSALGGALTVVNAIPGPVKAAALAVGLMVAYRKPLGGMLDTVRLHGMYAADSFRAMRTQAQLAGSAMPGIRDGLASVGSVAKSAGTSMLTAFGGPVGLAVAGVGLAVSALISVWQQAEQAAQSQKTAVDELTTALQSNSDATVGNTLTNQLSDVLPLLDQVGVRYDGLVDDIRTGGGQAESILKTLRDRFKELYNSNLYNAHNNSELDALEKAIKGLESVTKAYSSAQDQAARETRATGAAAEETAASFDSVKDAVEAAFSALDGAAAQTSALQNLAQSIIDNGNAIDTTTSGGIANLGALQSAIGAMADNAGDNYDVFVGNVSALMQYLDKQGVNTQNVMGAVRAAVENVAGKRYAIFFDGSQFIAESNQVVKAARATIAAATQVTRAGDLTLNRNTPGFNSAVRALRDFDSTVRNAAASTTYIGSTFRGVSLAASKSATATKAAGSSVKATGKSARQVAADLKALRQELAATAQEWLKPSRYSSEAQSLIGQINSAYADGAISKKTRESIKKSVRSVDLALQKVAAQREKLADRIDAASQALADAVTMRNDFRTAIIDGVRDLADVSKYTAAFDDTVATLRDQYRALVSLSKYTAAADPVTALRAQYRALASLSSYTAAADDSVATLRDQYRALGDLSKYAATSSTETVTALREQYAALGALGKFAGEVEQTVTSTYTKGGRQYTVQQVIKQQKDAASMIDGLKAQVSAAQTFQANVKKLQKLGLNDTSLSNLMSEFLSSGDGTVIAELVKGGASAVAQVNSLTSQLESMAGKTETVSQTQAATRKAMTDGLRDQVAQAKSFKTAYAKLEKLGLNDVSLANLLSGFMSSGDASQITALVAGGKSAVAEVNTLMSQLGSLAGKTQTAAQEQTAARKAMTDGLRDQVNQAKTFKTAYAKLQKLGLNTTSLTELFDDFMSSGDASQVSALVAGGKSAVAEVNRLMGQLSNLAGTAQTTAQKQAASRKALIDGLKDQVAQAKTFKTAYAKLEKLGLNETSLSNLMSDFMSSGDAEQIRALAAGGKSAVSQVNTLMSQLGNLAGKTQTVAQQQAATRKAVTDGLKDQLAQAKSFKSAYETLRKAGLNDTSLQDLMSDFLSTGDASQASALAKGGKSVVKEINGLMADIAKVTGTEKSGWAKNVAADMYQAGVDTASGFLKGLQSQDSILGKQYAKMADNLLATIKKKLGIKSPSKEMAKLAGFTSAGWNDNLHLDPITPDLAVPSTGSSTAGAGFGGEVWLMVDGEPVRAVVSRELAGAGAAKVAALRGGRRS